MARQLGSLLPQCIVLCNLGIVQQRLGELDEARTCFDASLAIARERGLQLIKGQTLGYLGLLHASCDRFADADIRLDAGETILRRVSYPASLGILLSCRVEADQRRGAVNRARAALAEGEAIAAEVAAAVDSEFGAAIAAARRSILAARHAAA